MKSSMIKKITYKGSIKDAPKNSSYWKTRPVEERLAAVEFLRKQFYGDYPQKMERVIKIVKRKSFKSK
jgi:hypothetical protein